MYLLYLDESGNEKDPVDRHFILAGAAVFERQTYYLAQELEAIQARHFPRLEPLYFHAQHIRAAKGFWRNVEAQKRREILEDLVGVIARSNHPGVVLFGAVVEKSAQLHGEEAVKRATEEVCRRFDLFLAKRHHDYSDTQRGLLVFSEGRFDAHASVWVQGFRKLGTAWGVLNNLADIPFFATPKDTRLLQVADIVAHALYLLYERRNAELLRPFVQRFNQEGGVLHGLAHVRADTSQPCDCPACQSRRTPHNWAGWLGEGPAEGIAP